MKKQRTFLTAILIAGLLLVSSDQLFSQIGGGLFLNVGGATISNHDGSALRLGAYNIGGFVNTSISDQLALEAQLSLADRGDKYDDSFTGGSYEGKILMSYIQLALMVRYINEQIGVGFGPSVGVLMAAKDKGDAKYGPITQEYDEDFKDDAESTEVGVNLEVIYKATDKIDVGIVGQKGLTKLYDVGNGDNPTSTFFGLVFRFNLIEG